MKTSKAVDKATTFPIFQQEVPWKTSVKTQYRLQKRWPHTTTWQIWNFLWNYIVSSVLHYFIQGNWTWEVLKALLYLLKNTVNQTENNLIFNSLGICEKIFWFVHKNYICSKKYPKPNSSRIPPRNYSLKYLSSRRTNIYKTMSFPDYKQINHTHLFLKGWMINLFSVLTYLTYMYLIAKAVSSYSNIVHFTTQDRYCILIQSMQRMI